VEELKRSILQLEASIASAKERRKEAEAEAAKLEKDMQEFGQNKESKLKELKVSPYSRACLTGTECGG
jgi:structural maintenance of chromosome 2